MASGASRSGGELLERRNEVAAITGALDEAAAGRGGVLLLEGTAGIGKTRLLWELRRLAGESGFEVLGARCDELEESIAFGIAAQLLTAPLQRADRARRAELLEGAAAPAATLLLGGGGDSEPAPVGDPSQALLRGLTWLVTNLARSGPVALLIDDAHWADPESLRWLNHLEKGIGDLPVLVAATVRRGEAPAAEEILRTLVAADESAAISPEPLSPEGSAALLERRLSATPSPALVASAQEATGGNPLLLDALALELVAQGAGAGAQAAEMASGLVPDSIVRTVLLRLRRLPESARGIAEALTILGEAPLTRAAEMAGLTRAEGDAGVEALEAAEMVEGEKVLRFSHPILRSTIYEQISPRRRHARHVQAARLLHSAGEQPERIAPHLIAAGDVAIPGGAEILIEAGRRVYALGAPEATVRYLLRALELDPDPGTRAEILLQLGAAAIRSLDGSAVGHLQAAVEDATTDAQRRSALMELARAHLTVLDLDAAADTFERALAISEGDRELELSAIAELASAELNLHRFERATVRIDAAVAGVGGETAAERKLLAVAAFASAQSNAPAERTLDLATRALGDGDLVAEQSCASVIVMEALFALVLADGEELLERELEVAIADARERGWPIGVALASTISAWLHIRRGELALAAEEVRTASDIRAVHGATPLDPFVIAFEAWLRADAGRPEDGLALIAERLPEETPDAAVFQLPLLARGVMRLLTGSRDEGIADVMLVGERELRFGGLTPSAMAWRTIAARGLAARGEHARARELAAEELELAEALGTERAIGIARRGVALVGDEERRIAGLEEAVEHLRRSSARLDLARTLVELGVAMRHAKRPREAREPLREAVELARACGSAAVERRALDELGAAGEGGHDDAAAALGGLTPSELRVARMAVAGMSNRDIAAELDVGERTVEVHLTRTYRKLGVRNRRALIDERGGELSAAD
ncbi:MAG: AAA family ATPase [Solirubrobacterales bacterium]